LLPLASKLKNLPSGKPLLSVDEQAEPGPGESLCSRQGGGSHCEMSPSLPRDEPESPQIAERPFLT